VSGGSEVTPSLAGGPGDTLHEQRHLVGCRVDKVHGQFRHVVVTTADFGQSGADAEISVLTMVSFLA
jgi:hypothetical protein